MNAHPAPYTQGSSLFGGLIGGMGRIGNTVVRKFRHSMGDQEWVYPYRGILHIEGWDRNCRITFGRWMEEGRQSRGRKSNPMGEGRTELSIK